MKLIALLLILLSPLLAPNEPPQLGDFSQSGITVNWINCGSHRSDPASYDFHSSDGSYSVTIPLTFITEQNLQCVWTAPIPILPRSGQYSISNGVIGNTPIQVLQYGPTTTINLKVYRTWLQFLTK